LGLRCGLSRFFFFFFFFYINKTRGKQATFPITVSEISQEIGVVQLILLGE